MSSILPAIGLIGPNGVGSGITATQPDPSNQSYTSLYGTPIPLSQGVRKITGQPIWAGPVQYYGFTIAGIAPSTNGEQLMYQRINRSFAVSLGYNLAPEGAHDTPKVRRIWVDGKLAYANGNNLQPVFFDPASGTYTPSFGKLDPGAIQSSGLQFRFYPGSRTQMPDSEIVADRGIRAPAYRSLMYMVISDLVIVGADGNAYQRIQADGNLGFNLQVPSTAANRIPLIEVELADGQELHATSSDFSVLPERVSFPNPGEVVMTDFRNRLVAVVSGTVVQTYDMDAKAEIAVTPITPVHAWETLGNPDAMGWDQINDVIYGPVNGNGGGNGWCIAALNRKTGVVTNAPYDAHNNLGIEDASGGNPVTSGLPVAKVPQVSAFDVGYYLNSGSRAVVIYGCGAFATVNFALTPSTDGTVWPTTFPVTATTDFGFALSSVRALPLVDYALVNGRADFQDTAFVVAFHDKVRLVYVTVRNNIATIAGSALVHDAADATVSCRALLDEKGNIVVITNKSGLNSVIKVAINYDLSPDYALVPGWNGFFPHVATLLYKNDSLPTTSGLPDMNSIKFSDVSHGTMLVGNNVVNLGDGSSVANADLPSLIPATTSGNAWDSVTSVDYIHGTTGLGIHNLKWVQVNTAIAGDLGALGNYLKWYAERAGYAAGSIDVDPLIADQIVGSLVVTPTNAATLFDQLGVMFGFIWFVSAGRLKFVKSSRSPVKATDTLTVASQPPDGSNVHVGAVVYTFKDVPAAPYDVQRDPGGDMRVTLGNLVAAINKSGTNGVQYFSVTAASPDVTASLDSLTIMRVTAKAGGTGANSTTVSSSTFSLSWATTTLTGGTAVPTPSVNLTLDNMMAVANSQLSSMDALVTTFPVPSSIPQAVAIVYYNLDANYSVTTQAFSPDTGTDAGAASSVNTYNMPLVMAAADAYGRIVKTSVSSTAIGVTQEVQLAQSCLRLEPSDIASVTIGPFNYTIRLNEVTFNADFTISVTGENYAFRDDIPVNYFPPSSTPEQTVVGPGDAVPIAIDAPLLDPAMGSTAGQLVLMDGVRTYGQSGWTSSSVNYYDDTGTTITGLFTLVQDVKYGTTTSALPDTTTPFVRDDTTVLRVILKSAQASDFATATDAQFFSGANMLLVGGPGRWEYILFQRVTVLTSKVVELSGFARGRRGTETKTGTHQVGDEVYLVRSVAAGFIPGLVQQPLPKAMYGHVAHYTALGNPMTRPPANLAITISGESLVPFAPCALKGALVAGNDINLSWSRRDRLATKFVTYLPPMSESAEKYDLEILNGGGAVVRTLTDLTTPSFTYTSANQTTDGFTPPLATLKVNVYQKGELGRGYRRQETINVS